MVTSQSLEQMIEPHHFVHHAPRASIGVSHYACVCDACFAHNVYPCTPGSRTCVRQRKKKPSRA